MNSLLTLFVVIAFLVGGKRAIGLLVKVINAGFDWIEAKISG